MYFTLKDTSLILLYLIGFVHLMRLIEIRKFIQGYLPRYAVNLNINLYIFKPFLLQITLFLGMCFI